MRSRMSCRALATLGLLQSIVFVPSVESLLRGLGYLTKFSPRVEIVIDGEVREDLQCRIGHRRSNLIKLGAAEDIARDLECGFLGQVDLMLLIHHSAPRINLLVNVDLHRAHV